MPPVTTALIAANVAMFLLEQAAPGSIYALALWPLGAGQAGGASFAPWQLVTYGIYFPNNRVMLIFPPIPMPARVFVLVYAALELFLGVTGTQEGVAHFAHLGGMIGGFALLRHWRGPGAGRRVIR